MEETAQYFENGFFIKRCQIFTQNFMPRIEIMKFCQNHWSLIRGQFFMNSNPHFQALEHLILKIINYFLPEQGSDPDPHSVSYGADTGKSMMPIEIRIRQNVANLHGSRPGSEILMKTYTDFGQGMISGISQTPLSIPGFQSFHVCNEVGEPQLDLFALGLQLCQLCPQLKKSSG
jgi:hypothetical protein